jgi:hypothetical protein
MRDNEKLQIAKLLTQPDRFFKTGRVVLIFLFSHLNLNIFSILFYHKFCTPCFTFMFLMNKVYTVCIS